MRFPTIAAVAIGFMLSILCIAQERQTQPIANVTSAQSDRDMYGVAMWDAERSKYAEARGVLQQLISTYPESQLVARAKLAIGDSWFAQGDLKRAESEYRDFITFFPNSPEAAQARQKIAEIAARPAM